MLTISPPFQITTVSILVFQPVKFGITAFLSCFQHLMWIFVKSVIPKWYKCLSWTILSLLSLNWSCLPFYESVIFQMFKTTLNIATLSFARISPTLIIPPPSNHYLSTYLPTMSMWKWWFYLNNMKRIEVGSGDEENQSSWSIDNIWIVVQSNWGNVTSPLIVR